MAIVPATLGKLQTRALAQSATITAASNQTAIDLQLFDGQIIVILNASAAGSGATVSLRLEDSADNSSFAAVTGGGFTAVANAVSRQVIATLQAGDLRRYLRLSCTAVTGSASSVVSCNLIGSLQYEGGTL